MNENKAAREVEVEEITDLGDAVEETRQWSSIWQVQDTCCSWTYFGE